VAFDVFSRRVIMYQLSDFR